MSVLIFCCLLALLRGITGLQPLPPATLPTCSGGGVVCLGSCVECPAGTAMSYNSSIDCTCKFSNGTQEPCSPCVEAQVIQSCEDKNHICNDSFCRMCPTNQSLQVLDDNSCLCSPSGSTCELCASTTPSIESSFHCDQWDVLQLDASWSLSAGDDYCQAARSVNDSSSWAWFKFHKGISITASTLSISLGYWPSSGSSSGCPDFVSVATLPIGSVVGLYLIPDIIFAIPYGGMGGFFIYCANTFDVCRALMDVHICQL